MRENVIQKVSVFVSIVLSFIVLFLMHFGWLYYEQVGNPDSRRIEVKVAPGATLNEVRVMLVEKGLLDHPDVFRWAAWLFRREDDIQAGRYLFRYGESVSTVLGKLTRGEVEYARIAVPEGLMLTEIASLLQEKAEVDSAAFHQAATDSAFIAGLGIDAPTLEGYLFPDTYLFDWPLTPRAAAARMVHRFCEVYKMHVRSLADSSGFSLNQVVTLASIIQAEAVYFSEMPHISAVYHNRLERAWRLEADPTVAYALGGVRRRLWYKDLRVKSPYNTYRVRGLPPGPINSPGKAALISAVQPLVECSDLYFVANGSGRHIFSKTLKEHLRAKEQVRNGGVAPVHLEESSRETIEQAPEEVSAQE